MNRILILLLLTLGMGSLFAQPLDAPGQTFFSQLAEGDEVWEMEYTSMGCFHRTLHSWKVYQKKERWYADFSRQPKSGKGQTIRLSEAQWKAFLEFEASLRLQVGDYGCTTVDDYQLRLGDQTWSVRDGSCSFEGYYRLIEAMDLKDQW